MNNMTLEDNIPMTKDWSAKSSQVSRTFYREESKGFYVLFKTKGNPLWVYTPVELEVWKESLETESIGKFVNVRIKPNYEARKIS